MNVDGHWDKAGTFNVLRYDEYAYDPVRLWVTNVTGPGTPGTAAWSNTCTRYFRDAAGNVTNALALYGAGGLSLTSRAVCDGWHNARR